MRSAIRKLSISENKCFEIYRLQEAYFDPQWHFHPEFQLFTVLKGTGTRFIGDHVAPFKAGEVVFTGSNLPHLWRSDPEYFEGNGQMMTDGIVIYFHKSMISEEFLQKDESIRIRQLLQAANRGMIWMGTEAAQISRKMMRLLQMESFERILLLLEILNDLAKHNNFSLLSSEGYSNTLNPVGTERMRKVHAYVMQNFTNKITLEEVAEVANMTPAAFSRYFKRSANRTFSNFISEIRIGYACKLLIENRLSSSQACFQSGFNTLSNFNKQFKSITGMSPLKYKRLYETT